MMHSHSFTSLAYGCLATTLFATPYLQAQDLAADNALPLRNCAAVPNDTDRLACFDALAAHTSNSPRSANAAWYGANAADHTLPSSVATSSATTAAQTPAPTAIGLSADNNADVTAHAVSSEGCRDTDYDTTSRMWELTRETDCGNFRFRGYRPISFALSASNRVNKQPYSPGLENGLAEYQNYQRQEARIQLSIRTKLASNILTSEAGEKRDSLWFGYTSNSSWQMFNSGLSRPFRNTDYQPELIYVYPLELQLPWSSTIRYAGFGFNHQSNGQSNPLSRSWNRYYAMLGVDVGSNVRLQARIWKRVNESAAKDDNPFISDYMGRGEFSAAWDVNNTNTLTMAVRHSLRDSAKGSTRIEWYRTLGDQFAGGKSNLRLYTSIFSGYGDSMIDYNYRRTVLSVGFSLLDF